MIDTNIEYPDYAFRGLTDKNHINIEFNRILGEAFCFDGKHPNEDGYDELSINWDDDENSLDNLKIQKKANADTLKYGNGIVRIPTSKLKEMKNRYKGYFTYERKPVENNDYHGNLLLNFDGMNKQMRRLISNELALNVDMVHTYNENKMEWDSQKLI